MQREIDRRRTIVRGRFGSLAVVAMLVVPVSVGAFSGSGPTTPVESGGTFSIVAMDSTEAEWGVAVLSPMLAAGSVMSWARAGHGAIATQALTNPAFGGKGLELLPRSTAGTVVDSLLSWDRAYPRFQFGVVDLTGRPATYTGARCQPWAGGVTGRGYAIQGFGLSGPEIVDLAAVAFQEAEGGLAERLLAGLRGGREAGGAAGYRSAAILVVKKNGGYLGGTDRYVDLRVDDHADPLGELGRLYRAHARNYLPAIHVRLGDDALRAGDRNLADREFSRVIHLYRRAIIEAPKDPGPRNGLAWFFVTHRVNLDEAHRLATDAQRYAPRSWQILDTLAEISYARGEYQEAETILLEAMQLSPGNQHLIHQAERIRAAMIRKERR